MANNRLTGALSRDLALEGGTDFTSRALAGATFGGPSTELGRESELIRSQGRFGSSGRSRQKPILPTLADPAVLAAVQRERARALKGRAGSIFSSFAAPADTGGRASATLLGR